VPDSDYAAIVNTLAGLSRVVVESHPALIGPRVDRLIDELRRTPTRAPALEVAMGLETAHPDALERLNKRFTLEQFQAAARALRERGIALRVFLLISPPFVPGADQDDWLLRSLDAAFACGASVVSLIPTRGGNGTIEALAAAGEYRAPTLESIERSFALALAQAGGRGVVLHDLWELDRFAADRVALPTRRAALDALNRAQAVRA
jgi:radical SAM enzyme (TIGR01210 family)